MIRYKLACPKAHEFEAWFASSDGYDAQVAKKLVACPKCGSTAIRKALMAPSVVTSERKAATRGRRSGQSTEAQSTEALTEAAPSVPAPPSPDRVLTGPQREMLRKLKAMRDKVLAEAENVGPRFAEEARKIHHDETPARGIYGEASRAEVEELVSEGIEVYPIPVLPEDQN